MRNYDMNYAAKITKEGKYFLADFPDCPGCQTFATSKKKLEKEAADALNGWLESHLAHGNIPPRPKYKGANAILVPIDLRLAVSLYVRWRRQDRNLTQEELAKLVHLKQQQIAKIENPTKDFTFGTVNRLFSELGISFIAARPIEAPGKTSRNQISHKT